MTGLKDLLLRMRAHDCRFVLVGGFGSVAWGSSITTRDVDVACDMSPDNLLRVWQALADLDPVHRMTPLRLPFTEDETRKAGWKDLYLSTRSGQIDLLGEVLGIGPFEECLLRSVPIRLGGTEIRILSLDAMIQAKRAMGRPKDLQTVIELEAIRAKQHGGSRTTE